MNPTELKRLVECWLQKLRQHDPNLIYRLAFFAVSLVLTYLGVDGVDHCDHTDPQD
jgi:hypothetical protein